MIESNFKKDLEKKIDLYVNGELDQEQIDELWAELIQDEYYLEYTKSVANIKAIIERQRSEQKKAPVYKLRQYANYGMAAAIAIIIGVIGVMNYSVPDDNLQVGPVSKFDLGVVRSADSNPSALGNEAIKEAVELASNGEVDDAISLLETELNEVSSPAEIAEVSLTLGSIQYNYGNYTFALENFNRVVQQDEISILTLEKGYWYLGNTLFQLDRLPEAKEAFETAYDLDGAYSRIAKTYIDALQEVR